MLRKKYIIIYSLVMCIIISIVFSSALRMIEIKDIQAALKKQSSPKYIFYFIGDGMGINQIQLAQYYKQHMEDDKRAKLVMTTFPVTGLVSTRSVDSLFTDSAASGTALATGKKTRNRFVSVCPDGKESYKTLLEAAEEKGMSTGLISDVSIVDATPAAFAAHVKSRAMKDEIAVQYLYKNIDYIAGGGLESFIPQTERGSTRRDDRNLLQEFEARGYTIINSKQGLLNIDKSNVDKVLALFSLSYMPLKIDKINDKSIYTPSLADMLKVGIDVLFKNKKGFFMVVEEGKIDYAGHSSDTVALVHQMFELDSAVQVAYDFYKKHPDETLIVVTSDHETGGLILGLDEKEKIDLEPIDDVKASVFSRIYPRYRKNPKDIKGLLSYIEWVYNIKLTKEEKSQIEKELRKMSVIEYKRSLDKLEDFGSIIDQIISKKTNVGWASGSHTVVEVPVMAIGMGSQLFCGYLDNTDVARTIAQIAGLALE